MSFIMLRERLLSWHHKVLSFVGDQAYHCCVIGKLNGVGVLPGDAVMREQGVQEVTEHAPLRDPCVEEQRGRCVATYPHHLGAAR